MLEELFEVDAYNRATSCYESKVQSIRVEMEDINSNTGELDNIQNALKEYEQQTQELLSCMKNSRDFSNLFPLSRQAPRKSNEKFLEKYKFLLRPFDNSEEAKKRSALHDKVSSLSDFDDMAAEIKKDRENRENFFKQKHRALFPSDFEIRRAHWKRREKQRAVLVLFRFFKKSLKGKHASAAGRVIYRFMLLANKRKRAAKRIQACWRRYIMFKKFNSMKLAARVVIRAVRRKLLMLSARRKMQSLVHLNNLVLRVQALLRGIRGRRMFKKLIQDKKEHEAAIKIQNMYFARFGRCKVELLLDQYRRKKKDSDDIMILREILRPKDIMHCIGKWVLLSDKDEEELVKDVDKEKGMLIILFGDIEDDEEYEVPFDSTDIVTWFKMSSQEDQEKEEAAACTIQKAIRGKLARKYFFNLPVNRRKRLDGNGSSAKKSSSGIFIEHDKPPLTSSKGWYVKSPAVPNRKGMVETYDAERELIRVLYDADDFLLEKVFKYSDDLVWYKKDFPLSEKKTAAGDSYATTNMELAHSAAVKVQASYRGRYQRRKLEKEKEKKRKKLEDSRAMEPIVGSSQGVHLPGEEGFSLHKPRLEEAPGWWVWSKQSGGKEGAGFVQSVVEEDRVLIVDFTFGREEPSRVSYFERGLKWYQPPEEQQAMPPAEESGESLEVSKRRDGTETKLMKRDETSAHSEPSFDDFAFARTEKPPISQAPGCWIRVGDEDTEGLVDKVNVADGSMTVMFDSMNSEEVEERVVSYNSPDITWLASSEDHRAVGNDADGSVRINMEIFSPTSRPQPGEQFGSDVFICVPAEQADEEDDIAKVQELDHKRGLATVLFVTSASDAKNICFEEEEDNIPFLANEIKWMKLKDS